MDCGEWLMIWMLPAEAASLEPSAHPRDHWLHLSICTSLLPLPIDAVCSEGIEAEISASSLLCFGQRVTLGHGGSPD